MKLNTSPFSRSVAAFFSFLLSFSFSLQIHLLPPPTHFRLIMSTQVVSYCPVRQSCEALRMRKELQPSLQGSSSALADSVGVKIIPVKTQPRLAITSPLQPLWYYGHFFLFQQNTHLFSHRKILLTRPLC